MAYSADRKPLELTALTALASDDTIIVGDTSDTSEVAKAITKANFITDFAGDFATDISSKQNILAEGAFVDGDKTKLDTYSEANQTTNNAKVTYPSADSTKVGHITVTQAVNLDTMESDIANKANTADLATVATSGDYDDLSNKPDLSAFDNISEHANAAAFPGTGAADKFYLAQDTGILYRWTGSAFAIISAQLALGETSSTAYRGDRGATAFDHVSATDNPHSVSKAQVGLSNVPNTDFTSSIAAKVSKTGNETVAGVKTFSSSPIIPAPSTDLQAATKKYVDDNGGGGGTVDVVSNVATDTILGRTTAGTGDSEQLTASAVRTLINVEDGATADQDLSGLLPKAGGTMTGNIALNGNYLSGDGDDEGVFVDSSGDVGIGTTDPQSKLDVRGGDINVTGDGDVGKIYLSDTAGSLSSSITGGNSSSLTFNATYLKLNIDAIGSKNNLDWALGNRYFNFITNGNRSFSVTGSKVNTVPFFVKAAASQTANLTEWEDSSGSAMTVIDAEGNVGIGTTAPDTKLHVTGAVTQEPLSSDPADPDAGNSVQWVSDGTGTGDAGDVLLKVNVGGTTKVITLIDYSVA